MPLRGAPLLILCAVLALAPSALAAPDAETGGVEVPDTPTGGTEGGAFLPQAGDLPSEIQPGVEAADPEASASQADPGQAPAPAQNGDDPDVDVDVPVPPTQPQPTTPTAPPTPVGGLASTGFAAGVLALLGLIFGASGLALLRMSAPARLRRRAERRAARARSAGHRTRRPTPARARY